MNQDNNLPTSEGFVYVFTNEAMPGYIKIGQTSTSIEQRLFELSRPTSVPLPFQCHYAARVANVSKVESALHDAFGDHRINPRREFFKISPERIVAVLRLLEIEEVILAKDTIEFADDKVAVEKETRRRGAFNFRMVDIPAGAELRFIRDEKVISTVAPDQKHVIFEGQQMSISEAASTVLGSKNWVQGPKYWMYEEELLDERRMRMESSDECEI